MVRPDANRPRALVKGRRAGRVGLAGGSPAAGIAGDPRSRLQPRREISVAERSVESPVWERAVTNEPGRGEQSCGPSRKRTLQPREIGPRKGGMAEPVMPRRRQETAPESSGGVQDIPGVGRRARSDSPTGNRRDPPRRLTSSRGRGYKPSAKCREAGRESEGSVVPVMAGESRTEGRGPALVVLVDGRADEGMP